MRSSLSMAWQVVRFYKWRTLILCFCLFVTICLPLGLRILISAYQDDLEQRARTTPLVLGHSGHRFDLTMNALYFEPGIEQHCTMADADRVLESGLASAYPVFARYTCRDIPIAGVTTDYFNYRGLVPAEGTLPLMLGDVVLGAGAAETLEKTVGDTILSDQVDLYSLAAEYPLRMNVVGILAPAGTADDQAVFADLKTAWIIEGLVHGHVNLAEADQQQNILKREQDNLVGNANVTTYIEITEENIASFHLHGEARDFPLTSVICMPLDEKSGTILKARYGLSEDRQLLVPSDVIDELMRMVFKVEAFFQTSLFVVATATAMLLALIVLLSLRLREDEFQTLHAIGCSRQSVALMVVAEWLLILAASAVVSALAVFAILHQLPNISRLL